MKPGGRSESRRRQESTLVLSLGSRSIQLGPPAREEVMHCPLEKTCVHILTRSSTAISKMIGERVAKVYTSSGV